MRFVDFARNYLNPFYVAFRLGWLGLALAMFLAWIGSSGIWYLLAALILAWNGLRPWGKGKSINDMSRAVNDFKDKLEKRR